MQREKRLLKVALYVCALTWMHTHMHIQTHSKQINVKTKIFEGFKKLNKITQRNEEKKGRGGTEGGRKEEK